MWKVAPSPALWRNAGVCISQVPIQCLLWVKGGSHVTNFRCPLLPHKQTFERTAQSVEKCQKHTLAALPRETLWQGEHRTLDSSQTLLMGEWEWNEQLLFVLLRSD